MIFVRITWSRYQEVTSNVNKREVEKIFLAMANVEESREISPGEDFPLHQGVFNGDLKLVSQLIRVHDVAQKDVHGEHLTYDKVIDFLNFSSLVSVTRFWHLGI